MAMQISEATRTEATRATMEAYLDVLAARGPYGRYFADDVVLSAEGAGLVVRGRDAVEQAIRGMHEQAFDATMRLKLLLVGGAHAAIEANMVGRHTGEFQGIAATGRKVDVPYSVIYDLRGDKITALRLYQLIASLMQQIGG